MSEKDRSSVSWNPISLVKTTKGTVIIYIPCDFGWWYLMTNAAEKKLSSEKGKSQKCRTWKVDFPLFVSFFLSHSWLYHETGFNISQAGLELGIWLKMALNFRFSCLYLPSPGIKARVIMHGLWGAWDGSQDIVHARQALYQLSYVVKPYPSPMPSPVFFLPPHFSPFLSFISLILFFPLCSLPKGSILEPL